MQKPTPHDVMSLTDLIRSIRPEWERFLVQTVIESHAQRFDLADLVRGTISAASDPAIHSPKGLFWGSAHWRGLKTQPTPPPDLMRCGVCGLREDKCWTQRPGPDDHVFEPVERVTIR